MKTNTPPNISKPLAQRELTFLVAATLALGATAVDVMLPSLAQIGDTLNVHTENDRQLVIILFIIASGTSQIFVGPLVDRYGRKSVFLWSLIGYLVGTAICVVTTSFEALLAARIFQGFNAGATRVAVTAIARDHVSGRKMAEVMSLAMVLFMAVPILAPAMGEGILFFTDWRGIFAILFLYGLLMTVWVGLRVRETLTAETRKPLNIKSIWDSYAYFFSNRTALGYTVAGMASFASMFAYVSTSQQIFQDIFGLGKAFSIAFASLAMGYALAALFNSRFVMRIGMRRLAHGAFIGFIATNAAHLLVIHLLGDMFWIFMIFTGLSFFCMGLISSNATSIALEPMGRIAGSAAAANGFATTAIAGVIGGVVARQFDGSTAPIFVGFLIVSIAGFLAIVWAEKGRLFQANPAGAET
ncbi:MAG: multidrug effflux MFS transporter [Pseudomonadota bacterium]